MTDTDILNKIVEEKGNCCWANPNICKLCPLSRLNKKSNGSYMSCVEALGVQEFTEEEADARYLEVATRILLSEAIDDILKDEDGIK